MPPKIQDLKEKNIIKYKISSVSSSVTENEDINAIRISCDPETKKEKEWDSFSKIDKIGFILLSMIKIILFIIFLYLFLLSLTFMSVGFTMVASYTLRWGTVIKYLLKNPFAALAIGIIATAIMQNATATTSIAVSMVGAGIIPDVQSAVPIIMGSNIGTCVTNSFIALTLKNKPDEFKKAFSAATLNDRFNLLSTAVLLPIEIFSNMLFRIANGLSNLIRLKMLLLFQKQTS